ncbi:unnamed protein product, partial [Cuscuta europaea]
MKHLPSEGNIKGVFGLYNANLLPRLEIVDDEGAVDVNNGFPKREAPQDHFDRRLDHNEQRYLPGLFVLLKSLLDARPELANPIHLDLHHRRVLRSLVEVRQLPGGQNGVGVGDDNGTVLAVNESDVGVGVVGRNGDDKDRLEAKILLDIEVLDVEAVNVIGGDLGLVDGVDIESAAAQGEDEKEEEATKEAYAFAATPARRFPGMVSGDVPAVWRLHGL